MPVEKRPTVTEIGLVHQYAPNPPIRFRREPKDFVSVRGAKDWIVTDSVTEWGRFFELAGVSALLVQALLDLAS